MRRDQYKYGHEARGEIIASLPAAESLSSASSSPHMVSQHMDFMVFQCSFYKLCCRGSWLIALISTVQSISSQIGTEPSSSARGSSRTKCTVPSLYGAKLMMLVDPYGNLFRRKLVLRSSRWWVGQDHIYWLSFLSTGALFATRIGIICGLLSCMAQDLILIEERFIRKIKIYLEPPKDVGR